MNDKERIFAVLKDAEVFDHLGADEQVGALHCITEDILTALGPDWSSDMEAAPRDGTWIEFCNAHFRRFLKSCNRHVTNDHRVFEWCAEDGSLATIERFTHWRHETPLPAPPHADTTEKG